MEACAGTEVGAPTCAACSSTLSNCIACSDASTCTTCDANYVLNAVTKKCTSVFTEYQGVKALPDSDLGYFTNPDGATSLTVRQSTHTSCSPTVILPFVFHILFNCWICGRARMPLGVLVGGPTPGPTRQTRLHNKPSWKRTNASMCSTPRAAEQQTPVTPTITPFTPATTSPM